MWGEFDYQLAWPFRGTITLELLADMSNTYLWPQNKSVKISFSWLSLLEYGSQVVDEEMNPGGPEQAQFVSHQSLWLYLTDDDCLYFRVQGFTNE